MFNLLLTVLGALLATVGGIILGWESRKHKDHGVIDALKSIMEECGPGSFSDKNYLRASVALNKLRNENPKCWKCKYLTEWDCNQPDNVVDGDGYCTGWKARKKSILFLRSLSKAWGFNSEAKK